jgi:hypothetical protein
MRYDGYMADRLQTAIELGARIKALQARIANDRLELKRLEHEMREVLGINGDSEDSGASGDSIADQALVVVRAAKGQPMDAAAVQRALNLDEAKIPAVRTALSRLYRAGQIQRPSAGLYACPVELDFDWELPTGDSEATGDKGAG